MQVARSRRPLTATPSVVASSTHIQYAQSGPVTRSASRSLISQIASPLPDNTPGPGTYDPQTDTTCRSHMIQSRRPEIHDSLSAGIDFSNIRSFPQIRANTIGVRRGPFYHEFDDTPGPALPPSETLPVPPITIGSQIPSPTRMHVPGPGAYDPAEPRSKRAVPSMERAVPRGELWVSAIASPGPGTYDIVPVLQTPKKWTNVLRNVRPIPVVQLRRTRRRSVPPPARERAER
jgi:hypothetical protein